MPPFQYDGYRSPYTGTIAQLMAEGTHQRAETELRKGQAWAQGLTSAAAGVSHAVDLANDPRRQLEAAQVEQHRIAAAGAAHVMAGRADMSRVMQSSVAPALGPNDSGPMLPNFLRKEGDVSVWDTDGISKLLVAHGFADLAPEFVKDLNALNGAHRSEMQARADALTKADDVIAQSSGLAITMVKRFGIPPIQALDAAVVQIRANGTVPEASLDPYLSRIKSQPDQGLAILEQMAARGHQKRIELGKDSVSINPNNPNDVIGNPNAGQPEVGTPAWYAAVRLGLIKLPPDPNAAAPGGATPPPAATAPVPAAPPAGRPASAQPAIAPQGIVYPDPGTATTAPDPTIIARGTPIQDLPSRIAPGADAAASTVLPTPAPVATPPPTAAPPAAAPPAVAPGDPRLRAIDAAQRAATDATHPAQHINIRLNGKDVIGTFVVDSTAPGGARIMYNGKDVSTTAQVIPAAAIQINAIEAANSANAPPINARRPDPATANIPSPISGLTPNAVYQGSLIWALEGKLPAQGLGNSPRSRAAREAVQNTSAAMAAAAGTDIPTLQAEYRANATALNRLLPQARATAGFVGGAIDNLQLALDASDDVPRTGAKLVNRYEQWAQGELTPAAGLTKFETYIYTAAREYAKVTSGAALSASGLTVSAAKDAERLLNAAQSPDAFAAAVDAMKHDMANVTANQTKQLREISSTIANFFSVVNGGGSAPSTTARPASGTEFEVNGIKVRIR